MGVAVAIVLCLAARPSECRTVPVEVSAPGLEACMRIGELVAARDWPEWVLERVKCTPGLVPENRG